MGFCLQLKLLLWKNLTLKRRKPVMLIFELVIPLVLFIILVAIRKKQPAIQFSASQYPVWPLPSAGLIAVMQAFCDRGPTDDYGFYDYRNATVTEFLRQLNTVAENNNFFQPGFSLDELSMIPHIYKSIVEDPIYVKDLFENHGLTVKLDEIVDDPKVIEAFLVKNMSFQPAAVQYFVYDAQFNKSSLYDSIFSTPSSAIFDNFHQNFLIHDRIPHALPLKMSKRSNPIHYKRDFKQIADFTEQPGLKHWDGWFYQYLLNRNMTHQLYDLLMLKDDNVSNMVPELIKNIITDTELTSKYICMEKTTARTMIQCQNQSTSVCIDRIDQLSRDFCSLNVSMKQQIYEFMKAQINTTKISEKLDMKKWDKESIKNRLTTLGKDINVFIVFKKTIRDMRKLADSLPQDYCHENATESVEDSTDETDEFNIDEKEMVDHNNATVKRKPNLPHAFLKIWKAMQKTICGREVKFKEKEIRTLKDMGLSKYQMEKLELLVHVLYNNPKVLYAPQGSAADSIIQKANETFLLFDEISQYATRLTEVSEEIKVFLNKNTTEENLLILKKIQWDILRSPLQSFLTKEPALKEFIADPDITNKDTFMDELESISLAACSWNQLLSGLSFNVFKGFRTEDEMLTYFKTKAYFDNVTVLAGVVFHMNDDGSLPNHMIYKIRQNATFTADTNRVRNRFWFPGPKDWGYHYYQFGFVWVQDIMERAMINLYAERDVSEPASFLQQFPYPCYVKDQFLFMIQHIMPLALTISWVYSVAMLVQHIVYEKEQRLKEVMKMMGLKNGVHWIAWFVSSFAQMTVTVSILTMILKFGKVLTYSNPWIVFFTMEVFGISIIMFSFLVSVLYSKAKIAAACAGIMYFMSYVPYMYIAVREEAANDIVSPWLKAAASLLAPTAFGLGAKYFAFYEEIGVGVQWSNIAKSPAEDDRYHLGAVIIMLLVDAFLYMTLFWYIENVHPGAFGLPKPWYFPFSKSYWCGLDFGTLEDTEIHDIFPFAPRQLKWWKFKLSSLSSRANKLSITEHDQASAMENMNQVNVLFEDEPQNLPLGVSITKLSKRYKDASKYAVKNLNLNFYEGQITAILGHNGAGKSTTMSILTGLFPPSSGSAAIYGHDIRKRMDVIRNSLGMCPQHNVLFNELTVEEHMWFYSMLKVKEKDNADIENETEKLITDLKLPKKRFQKVECLSGGMKRKLSVAIAFVGGSRTVILDEPTAGVDPYSRRSIWDLIIKYKKGRTIVLSTHHMDEADILGDRIAILEDGQLKCCGSPLYLKQHLGEGYHLCVVKLMDEKLMTKCSKQQVTRSIRKIVPTARCISESKLELHYVLPISELRAGKFVPLFQMLNCSKETLHITSFGVKNTTLEEVFIKVISDRRDSDTSDALISESDPSAFEPVSPHRSNKISNTLESSKFNFVTATVELHAVGQADGNKKGNVSVLQEEDEEMLEVGTGSSAGLKEFSSIMSDQKHPTSSSGTSGSRFPLKLQNMATIKERNITKYDTNGSADLPLLDEKSVDDILKMESDVCGKTSTLKTQAGNLHSKTAEEVHLTGKMLLLQQFWAILWKRYVCSKRNIEGLFSQILLPAFFVSVAMSVALTAPNIEDLPELILSTSQFFNLTPNGNVITYSNNRLDLLEQRLFLDASSEEIAETFLLPSGAGATCTLKSSYNNSVEKLLQQHPSQTNFPLPVWLFNSMCDSVFWPGVPYSTISRFTLNKTNDNNTSANKIDELNQKSYSKERKYPICYCSEDRTGFNCPKYGYTDPTTYRSVTSDVMIDISGQNESQYYLYTTDMFRLRRYGGISLGLRRKKVPYDFGRNSPSLFRKIAVRNAAKVWFNNKGYHAIATYLNVLNNAILRANLPASKGLPAAYGMTLINHPLPNTQSVFSQDEILQGNDVLIAIFIIVAMSFVPASFVLFLVYERYSKSKHLQIISGVHRIVYWVANYIWDICNYTVPAAFCIAILLIFDIPAYTAGSNFPAVVSLFLMYGWSITPVMYPASFIFKEPSSAYIFLIVINLFVGITCIVTSFLLEVFSYDEVLAKIHIFLKNLFLVFPNYCLGRGLMDIAFNDYYNVFLEKTGQYHKMRSPFAWELIGRNLVAMAVTGITFFIITLLCEYKFFRKPRTYKKFIDGQTNDDLDADVLHEKQRVFRGLAHNDILRVENLSKVYNTRKMGKHLAVDKLSWGIPPGECFGLLGVNGAGKSSTFRMLTGDTSITIGDAYINGFSVTNELSLAHKFIGYCPQFDALYDDLTAREHLTLYATLRGVPRKSVCEMVEWALKKLDLIQYADRPCGTYSGGNKRKISTAIALIGGPALIFLDEVSTGMDPFSKRFLWNLISSLVNEGRSIVFTSHSMEECEALCTRVAIMVNGRFKCMGSTQHLKNKFGDGYSITLRSSETETCRLERYFTRVFPFAVLKEKHHNALHYELSSQYVSLDDIFQKMEKAMTEVSIEDYSVSQNTLDNVFINFVKHQNDIRQLYDVDSPRLFQGNVDPDQVLMNLQEEIADEVDIPRVSLQLLPDIVM